MGHPREALVAIIVFSSGVLARDITQIDRHTDRHLQVRIARLAAPPGASSHADVYVLGDHGYELAKHGDNGFTCLIEREKPNTMEPECYDAEGSRTTLQVRLFVEGERAKGTAEEQIEQLVNDDYHTGKFGAPTRPGIVYMLSKYNYVLDPETGKIIHFPGHLMFYAPFATEKDIGSEAGAPYIVHPGKADALMIVVPATVHH